MDFGVFTMVPMWVLVHPRHPSPNWNLFNQFSNKGGMQKCLFRFVLKFFFLATSYSKKTIQYFLSTNLHLIFLQLNLISIVELNLVEFPFNVLEFNAIKITCKVIQYFCLNGT
jgi:hypothetical protein